MKKLLTFVLALAASSASAQISPPRNSGGSGTVAAGTVISGCTAYSIVYIDSAGALQCAQAPQNSNVSTAGNAITKINATITGASATSNFLNITGTAPASISADTFPVLVDFTISSTFGFNQAGIKSTVAGATASFPATGVLGVSTATNITSQGVQGSAIGAATNSIGVIGDVSAGTNRYGGYFELTHDSAVPAGIVALGADNNTQAQNIFAAFDNSTPTSTTGATTNITILDGAQMRLGNEALTSATMTPTIVAEARSVAHSYAWTNAMITALGAVAAGDITVATLPAKTQVVNAYVVIDTAATQATTLTVSCGDAIGGTPFINYIVPSDAKAAANTVYGDLISGAETGTALFDATTKFRSNYIPSYTATTLVTCHFIAGTTLNTVTASTGRLILITTLLP